EGGLDLLAIGAIELAFAGAPERVAQGGGFELGQGRAASEVELGHVVAEQDLAVVHDALTDDDTFAGTVAHELANDAPYARGPTAHATRFGLLEQLEKAVPREGVGCQDQGTQ